MAIGDNYVTLGEMKGYLGIPTTKNQFDDELNDICSAASREVELHCNRQFNKDLAVTSRVFEPTNAMHGYDYYTGWSPTRVDTDDFWTTTGLIVAVDNVDDASYSTVVTAADYELGPLNGIVNGQTGWPYYRMRLAPGVLPIGIFRRRRASVRITAQWGWSSVPLPVKQATKIIAAETFQMKDAPFGVAGSDQFGNVLRVRDNKMATGKLARYCRNRVMVG